MLLVRCFACIFCAASSLAIAQTTETLSGTTFHFIPGGRFIQGTDGGERVLQRAFPLSTTGQGYGNAEGPAHVTWLTKPFWIAETEVTVGQFRRFVDATGYQTSAERGGTEMVGWEPTADDKPLYQSHDFLRDAKFNWRFPGFDQSDSHPVVGVSYHDVQAYCRWLSEQDGQSYRLPTEAEWEFVCRAGTKTWFSFGDQARGVVHEHANLGNVELELHRRHAAERQWLLDWEHDPQDGHVFTAPVGSYQRNPWGIADLHGNVWEWCQDLWLDTAYNDFERPRYDQPAGIAVDPVNLDRPQTPTNDFHCIRGGSWYNGDLFCRSSNRAFWDADDASCYLGFRLARDADPNASTIAKEDYKRWQSAVALIERAGGKLHSSRGLDLEVRLQAETFEPSLFDAMKELPDLVRLRIAGRGRDAVLSQSVLGMIAELEELRAIEFQNGVQIQSLDLSVLSRLTSLQTLQFPRDAALADPQLTMLSGLRSLQNFECFGTGGGLTDQGIKQIANNRQLQSLAVWENDATGEFLDAFKGCPLERITSTARYGSEGAMIDTDARRLIEFPSLRALTLTGQTRLTGSTMECIGELSQLRELDLQRCSGLMDQDFQPIAGLTHLIRLDLSGTQAGDGAAAAIAQLPRIERLSIGDETSRPINAISDTGLEDLSQAFSIQELRLTSDRVTDEGIKHLGRINRLRDLYVNADGVTGSGLGPLSKLPELRDLSLRSVGLQDIAFDHLSRAKSVTKLRLAERGFRPAIALTNSGMMKMSNATWLKELWLPRNGTGITEEMIDQLKTQMPGTSVIPFTVTTDN